MKFTTDYWKMTESHIEFILSEVLSANAPVSAVKLISVIDNHILLVDTPKGWDIPGGHIEDGETTLEALHREVKEETGGILTQFSLVGYLQITYKIENDFNRRYPKVSCIAIYTGVVGGIADDDQLQHESKSAQYLPLNNLPNNVADWSQLSWEIVDYIKARQ